MSYISIPDFKFGMDRRRKRTASAAGTLWTLINGVISRGGDIERAKKFVPTYTLPTGQTFGLGKVRSQLYVFGSAASAGLTIPPGIQYQQLIAPSGAAMVKVLDVKTFSSKLYVIAEYADGNVYHFYNGARVTDYDAVADGNCSLTTLTEYLALKINGATAVSAAYSGQVITLTSLTPGTPFSLSVSATNNGADNTQSIVALTTSPNVVAVAEVAALGSFSITGGSASIGVNYVQDVMVNGVTLFHGSTVNWLTSNSATAQSVAALINNNTATHGYVATVVGSTITVQAPPGVGATANGYAITVAVKGTVTATGGTMAGGVTAVAPSAQISTVTLGGAFESVDMFTVTLNGVNYVATGRASGTGLSCFVSKSRMWSVAGTLLVGSQLTNPANISDVSTSSGKVLIDVSNASEGSERMLCMAEYAVYLAVFSATAIRLYSIATDATQIAFYKTVQNYGTTSNRAPLAYSSDDVFFPALTGIRELKPRDVVNITSISDIGTAIDSFLRSHVITLSGDQIARSVAAIEPIDGRYFFAIGQRVYVLSYFPTNKVNAWSYFEPGFQITDFQVVKTQLYARAGDTIYLYGGSDGTVYPNANETPCTVEFPFLSANSPPTDKDISGFDVDCVNEWFVELLPDPNDETKSIALGRPNDMTYPGPSTGGDVARVTHFALRFTCSAAGFSSISSVAVHFHGEDNK